MTPALSPPTRSCQRLLRRVGVDPAGQPAVGWVEEEKRWDLRAPSTRIVDPPPDRRGDR